MVTTTKTENIYISPEIDRYREQIFRCLDDLVSNLLYYDRKQDEALPMGKIEELVGQYRLGIGEMATFIENRLRERIPQAIEVVDGVVVEEGNPDIPAQ